MADHACTLCQKKRPGRFTRHKGSSGSGWSQGFTLPNWYCWSCLPMGQGRDEAGDDPMPSSAPKPTVMITPPANILKTKQEGLQVLPPLESAADELTVTDAETYQMADQLLSKVRTARKTWGERMEKIIRPIRQGLDEIYALNREVDRPLEALESGIKDKMKVFKLEEQRQLRAAEDAKEKERQRLQREADEKTRLSELAKTAQMRGKLAAQAARAQEQAETVAQQETPAPVQAASSTTRPKQLVRVANFTHFLQGIVDGYIPEDHVAVVQAKLNQSFKDDPEGMRAWPGVEIVDDIQIVGR